MPRSRSTSTLPEGFIIDVLLRLPVKTIIHCKSVCKTWHGIISDPYFVNLHMSTSPESLLYHPESKTVKWVEMEHEPDFHVNPVKSLDLKRYVSPPHYSSLIQIGSVNGLVCYWEVGNALIHIMNPVLDECVTLSRAREVEDGKGCDRRYSHCYGFGVSSAGDYKVVQITFRSVEKEFNGFCPAEIDVYTLGTGKWRSLGPPSCSLCLKMIMTTRVVYLKNHLYWQMGDFGGLMYDFDLDRETCELFPLPPVRSKLFRVVKGWISCISWCSLGMKVWVMKENTWCEEITINKNMNPLFFNSNKWRPECYIDGTSIMLVCDRRGRLGSKQLVAYCLDTNTVLPLNLDGHYYQTMTYRPSFLTLRNFGSERVHAL